MEMKFSLFCLLVIATSCSAQQPLVGFNERDYSAIENSGGRTVTVVKERENTDTLYLIVRALTFDDFNNLPNRVLTPLLLNRTLQTNPAEFNTERQDFNGSMEARVTFPPSVADQTETVMIPYFNDDINEAIEGFLVIVEIDETQTNASTVGFIEEGVALMVITNDDAISVGFNISEFTVNEDAGVQNNLIFVTKMNNVVTEQTLLFVIELSTSTAMSGVDFEIMVLPVTIAFSPDVQDIPIPVNITDDDILESTEEFILNLGRPDGSPDYTPMDIEATVRIVDNDVGEIGFEQTEYTGNEGENVQPCILLFYNGNVSDLLVVDAIVFRIPGTAIDDDHSFLTFGELIRLNAAGSFRMCLDVDLTDDSEIEGTESFTLQLEPDPGFTPDNILVNPAAEFATIFIRDNDAPTPPPSPTPDTMMRGDPHYSVLLPTGQLLCYSVHGEKDFTFNLISNDLLQMNARFIGDPIREEITWIGSLGIVVKNTPNPYSRSNITKLRFEAGEKKVYIGDKASLVAHRVERLTFHNGKLRISENPSLKKRKRHNVLIDLKDIGLSFSVMFVKDHLDLSWKRVDKHSRTSHGMIGQFFRDGNEVDETRKLLLLPNLDPVPVMRREVWHFMEREMVDDQLCWVAMNPGYQGKRLIEGHYLDYLVDDVLAGDFKFIGNSPKTI